jgi:hypothetical protein
MPHHREGMLGFAAAVPAGAGIELRITGLPGDAVGTWTAPQDEPTDEGRPLADYDAAVFTLRGFVPGSSRRIRPRPGWRPAVRRGPTAP